MAVRLLAALAPCLVAGVALAGGKSPCVAAGTCGGGLTAPATEVVERVERSADGQRVRRRIVCPYPWRPSDSVFAGGAGYIVKDDVRRATGCAR